MTDQKPEGKTKCPYCSKLLPDTWVMQAYDGFLIWVNEANQFMHRHNTTFKGAASAKKNKQKDKPTPTVTEKALLSEYFPPGTKIPASGRILVKKASGGDLPSLRELERRFGSDPGSQHNSPVQFEVSNGVKGNISDPRPILKIQKGLFSNPDTWAEEPEEEESLETPTIQEERKNTKPPVGTLSDPSTWDTDKARKQ